MKRFFGTAILPALLLLSTVPAEVRADKPDGESNGAMRTFVYRRNKDEPNNIGAICTVVHLDGTTAGKVSGRLRVWTKLNAAGTKYDGYKEWTLPEINMDNIVTGSRKREHCKWLGTIAPVPVAPNTDAIRVYASLFKGTNKSKGHQDRRLVLRCYLGATPSAQVKPKDATAAPCDEDPDDDVLEEENNDPGDPINPGSPSDMPPYDGG
jgi:hypothetical protein